LRQNLIKKIFIKNLISLIQKRRKFPTNFESKSKKNFKPENSQFGVIKPEKSEKIFKSATKKI